MRRYVGCSAAILVGLLFLGDLRLPAQGPARSMTGNANGEWPSYAADLASTQSPRPRQLQHVARYVSRLFPSALFQQRINRRETVPK